MSGSETRGHPEPPRSGAERRVLVSVLNYNVVDDTLATVRCLQEQTYGSFDLEVLDNASTNDSVAQIRTAIPDLTVRQNSRNTGYAGGMNAILERALQAGYEHVVICNNDIDVAPDTVSRLVAAAEERDDAGVVGGVEIDYRTGGVRAVGGLRFSLWRLRCDWATAVPSGGGTVSFAFAQGAMVLFTRRALVAGVRMDDRLFIYFDEADVGFQLKRRGLRAYVATDVRVRHKAQKGYLDIGGGYYMQRNRVYMVRKYGRFYHMWWHVVYAVLFELPAKAVIRTAQGHARYALACVRGFWDGLRGVTGMWNPG